MLLHSFLFSLLYLRCAEATALPQKTASSNSTIPASPAITPTAGTSQCWREYQPLGYVLWVQGSIVTTITAETLLYVVNNRTNSTRTSTIFNTEVDLSKYPAPSTTNSAGTVTTSIVLTGDGSNSTRYINFPTTAYEDYPTTYSLCGIVPTTISGIATSLTYQEGCDVSGGATKINSQAPTLTYPSHPPLVSDGPQTLIDLTQDPRGWTYSAILVDTCDDDILLRPLFPDLGLWSCHHPQTCVGPLQFHTTALLLTATSTSIEADESVSPSVHFSVSQPPTAPTSAVAQRPTSTRPVSSATIDVSPVTSSNNDQATTVSSIKSAAATPTPDDTAPVMMGSTDLVPTTSTAIKVPVLVSQSSAQGQKSVSTSVFAATPTAFINTVISATNAHGAIVSSTSQIPAVVLTKTNPEGDHFVTTTPVIPSEDSNPVATAPPALIIGSQTITADSENQYTIGSQTLSPGEVITESGTPIFLAPGGTEAVVGTRTQVVEPVTLPATSVPPALTIGTQTITPNAQGQYVVGSQTLSPGGAISASGSPISLASEGAYAIVGTSTQILVSATPPAIIVGSRTMTVNSFGQYTADGQTLSPGGEITVSGTPISLASSGAYAVVGTSTEELAITTRPAFTIGTQTISANSLNEYIVNGQTLLPGGIITVSGTPVSLATDETAVVVGTSTEGLGNLIVGGLGRNGSATVAYTGSAGRTARTLLIDSVLLVVGMILVIIL